MANPYFKIPYQNVLVIVQSIKLCRAHRWVRVIQLKQTRLTSLEKFLNLCSCIPKEALIVFGSQLHHPQTLLHVTLFYSIYIKSLCSLSIVYLSSQSRCCGRARSLFCRNIFGDNESVSPTTPACLDTGC